MITTIERWKYISGTDRNYKISSLGRVYSIITGKHILGSINTNGYRRLQLNFTDGKRKVYTHKVVADHFVNNPLKLPLVCHINHDKTDNRHTNLEYGTHKHNMREMLNADRQPKGSCKHNSKLTESDIPKIWDMKDEGFSAAEIAKRYSLHPRTIGDIFRGRNWYETSVSIGRNVNDRRVRKCLN